MERLGRVLRGEPDAAPVAVITGDAGIGKTRLLAEAIRACPDVLVLAGACLPMSESLPYGAVTDALSDLASPSARPALDRALGRCAPYVRSQMAGLIPALSEEPPGSSDSSTERSRLFAAVKDLLGALGAERRIALALEDLHWADPGTLDLLTFLVRRPPLGTALAVTSRSHELPADDPVADWLSSTARLPGVEPVGLLPLSPEDVAEMVSSLVHEVPEATFVGEVVRRGEGSPFFTEQLVAAARDVAPPLAVPPGVPTGVAQMLHTRVRSVGPGATEVAAVLAVAARPLGEPELAACVGTGVAVAPALRELVDAHLVEPAAEGRYRLRHALLEDTVRATLLASQRAALHAGVARLLVARGGESPGQVARHWARAGDPVEEARWSVAAARHAEGLFAWREASTSWRRVWELWSCLSDDELPDVELPDVVVACVRDAWKVDLASDSADSFLDLAREALADDRVRDDDYAVGQLLYAYGQRLGLTDSAAGRSAMEDAVARFERAGRPSAEHAFAIEWLVYRRFLDGTTTGTEDDELARATVIVEQAGDLGAVIDVVAGRAVLLNYGDRVEEALAVMEQVQQRAIDSGAGSEAGAGRVVVASLATDCYLWLLRPRDGVAAGREGIAQGLRDGQRESLEFSVLVANTVECLLLLGETEEAAALVADHQVPEVTVNGWLVRKAQAELDMLAGRLAHALVAVEQLDALGYQNQELWIAEAEIGAAVELWSGHAQAAKERVDRAITRIGPSLLAMRAGRMLAFGACAAADLADADRGLDRGGVAQRLQAQADEAECFGTHPGLVLGAAYGATFDAELARLRRDGEESAWRAAKHTWAGYDVPHHAAYAGWRLAECLLGSGRRTGAEKELAEAHAAAESHVPLRREIEALARRAGLPHQRAESSAQAVTAGESSDSPFGLTPRELEVLRVLGTGATNSEIGRLLYMSPKTASVHVSAIIRKLGVSGRVQAATVADRMGLLEHE
jgi:DNA-binding CsgD family transcriptional regulator